jgi:hypothetical protein
MALARQRFLWRLALCAGLGLAVAATTARAQEVTPEEIKAAETAGLPSILPGAPALPPLSGALPAQPAAPTDGPPGMPEPEPPGPACFWAEGGFQVWFLTPGPLPIPIFARGNPADPIPGALGQPGTQVLFGNQVLNYGPQAGVWLDAGVWLEEKPGLGLEAGGFWGSRSSVNYTAAALANGNPPTYIPIFRAELGREGSFTLADPALMLNGSAVFTSRSQLWGVEAHALWHLHEDPTWDVSLLFGFEHLALNEDITLTAYLRDPVADVNTTLGDLFATRNRFYGGQLGTRVRWTCCRWTLEALAKLGLGVSAESVSIDGQMFQNGSGVPSPGTFPGGLFTQPTNIGQQTHGEFAVVPQLRLNVEYALTPHLHFFAGYDCLYWSSVVRPGNQIDRQVNQTQQGGGDLVGPARPMPLFNASSLWVQGMTFGITVRY